MWALIIAVAALSVSAIAAWTSHSQLREARTSNAFPATVDLFREYRSSEMVAARRLLSQRLPDLDPASGISDLPDDVAQAALRISITWTTLECRLLRTSSPPNSSPDS
jgi:hypothetical protein